MSNNGTRPCFLVYTGLAESFQFSQREGRVLLSYGYDTVSVVFGQILEPVGGWDHWYVDSVTGAEKGVLNVRGVMQVTAKRHVEAGRVETVVQCSLPKLLWGQNIDTLGPNEVAPAVAMLDAAIGQYWPGWPSVASWVVRRVDCTANREYGPDGELVVHQVLRALQASTIRGRRPVVGDSGTSLSWSSRRGAFTRKVYAKLAESGQARAAGVLRVEVGAIGQQAVRRVMRADGVVTLGDVLGDPDFPKRVCRGFERSIVACEGGGVMTVAAAYSRLRVYLNHSHEKGGSNRAAQALGLAYLANRFGWSALGLERRFVWRAKKDLMAAGVDISAIEWDKVEPGAPLLFADDLEAEDAALLKAAVRSVD